MRGNWPFNAILCNLENYTPHIVVHIYSAKDAAALIYAQKWSKVYIYGTREAHIKERIKGELE